MSKVCLREWWRMIQISYPECELSSLLRNYFLNLLCAVLLFVKLRNCVYRIRTFMLMHHRRLSWRVEGTNKQEDCCWYGIVGRGILYCSVTFEAESRGVTATFVSQAEVCWQSLGTEKLGRNCVLNSSCRPFAACILTRAAGGGVERRNRIGRGNKYSVPLLRENSSLTVVSCIPDLHICWRSYLALVIPIDPGRPTIR